MQYILIFSLLVFKKALQYGVHFICVCVCVCVCACGCISVKGVQAFILCVIYYLTFFCFAFHCIVSLSLFCVLLLYCSPLNPLY